MAKDLIMVGLTSAQWDMVVGTLDAAHDLMDRSIKEEPELGVEELQDRKNYCCDMVEIMDDIADQIAGVVEEIEG